MFKHPNYYKELEKIRKEFEASLDPEAKPQAPSVKQQAPSVKQLRQIVAVTICRRINNNKPQAASNKPQASSVKQQALKIFRFL